MLLGVGRQVQFSSTLVSWSFCISIQQVGATDKYPLVSAARFWNDRKLSSKADIGVDYGTVSIITQVINGGELGLVDRIDKVNKYYAALTA